MAEKIKRILVVMTGMSMSAIGQSIMDHNHPFASFIVLCIGWGVLFSGGVFRVTGGELL